MLIRLTTKNTRKAIDVNPQHIVYMMALEKSEGGGTYIHLTNCAIEVAQAVEQVLAQVPSKGE